MTPGAARTTAAGAARDRVPAAPPPPRSQVSVKTAATVAATALGVVVAAWVVWKTGAALVLTTIALLLAVALDRAVALLERHRLRRGWAIALVAAAVLAVGAGLALLVVPKLAGQASALVDAIPSMVRRFHDSSAYHVLARWVDVDAIAHRLGTGAAEKVVGPTLTAVGWVAEALAGAVTVLFVTIFMLVAGRPLLADLVAQARPDRRDGYREVLGEVYRALSGYVVGHLAILAVQAVATIVALAVAGVPFFLPLGLLSALASLVPFAGVTVMGVGMSLLAWATSGLGSAIGVAVYYVVYQQFENHVLYPLVYRHTVHVNPLVIVLAVLFMADLAGIAGAILAVPATAAGHIVVAELLRYRRRKLGIA